MCLLGYHSVNFSVGAYLQFLFHGSFKTTGKGMGLDVKYRDFLAFAVKNPQCYVPSVS